MLQLSIHLAKDVLIQLHLVRIFWTIVMIIGAALRIKSVYLFMIPTLFNTFFMFIIHLFKLYYNSSKFSLFKTLKYINFFIEILLQRTSGFSYI